MVHRKFICLSVILTLCFCAMLAHASGYFPGWRPFDLRGELAPAMSKRKPASGQSYSVEKYSADIKKDYGGIIEAEDKKNEKKWNEYQFGIFRLRISRYHDLYKQNDDKQSPEEGRLWEMMKSISSRFGSSSYRDNLETTGRIFEPQLDLGIEF
ncbi:MAG: hypothetical protein Q7J31_07690 [Syntrophales bacterium]|nr:hypothetical protein [Syntrophales bacterium]